MATATTIETTTIESYCSRWVVTLDGNRVQTTVRSLQAPAGSPATIPEVVLNDEAHNNRLARKWFAAEVRACQIAARKEGF